VALLALLAGCQAVFTYSPLSFLQRDPANLPPEQQVSWAEQALASGDPQAMAQAYELVKDDPDQAYLAASLAAELSGVTQALADAIADLDTILGMDEAALQTYLEGFVASLDATYAGEAADLFNAALPTGELTGTDMVVAALCYAFEAVVANGGVFIGPPDADLTEMQSFITACNLAPEDPAFDLLDQINSL
jgi:hypothetical protein